MTYTIQMLDHHPDLLRSAADLMQEMQAYYEVPCLLWPRLTGGRTRDAQVKQGAEDDSGTVCCPLEKQHYSP